MFWRHYVYIHREADTGMVFYVGKGTIRKRKKSPDFERAHTLHRRNQWWKNVVAKHGLVVEVIAMFQNDVDSQKFEKLLIAEYGRDSLVNLTDGGDGHCGIIISDELREKRRNNARGVRGEAWVTSIRRARKNGGNGGVVKRGDKLPEEWRQNISKGVSGENNPMYGRTGSSHPNSRKVVDTSTGMIYESVSHAAEMRGFKMKTLYNWLSGHRDNPTLLRLI